MTAAAKHGERKGNGAKSGGKRAMSTRESKRTQAAAFEGAQNRSSAITNHAAEEEVVRRPRMELADALRARGVDEHRLAELYVHAFNKVRTIILKDADPKRSLDNLKELGRVLESKRTNERAGDRGGAQVVVQLVHQVARPERGMESLAAAREGSAGESREMISRALESFGPEMCAIDMRASEPRAENAFGGRD